MKIVYNHPVLALTAEEESALYRAGEILESICNRINNYDNCEHKCPIYEYCPYYQDFVSTTSGKIHEILGNIINEAEREKE